MKDSNNPFHDSVTSYKSSDSFRDTMQVLLAQIEEAEKHANHALKQWSSTRNADWLRYSVRRFTALAALYSAAGNISGNSTYFTYESNNKRLVESFRETLAANGWVMWLP